MRKVHFINRVDFRNAGDFSCTLTHYIQLEGFQTFQHDIDDIWWHYIDRDDIVILGAGGVLNVEESFNKYIIRLFDTCDTVVGYGIGFNKTENRKIVNDIVPHLDKFKIIGVRDYNNPWGVRYTPCPTVLIVDNYLKSGLEDKIKREVGVIHHKDFFVDGVEGFEQITNSHPLQAVLNFINTSETIITSSYHGVYWAQLMGKRVILARHFSEKFDYFRYKPVMGVSNLTKAEKVPSGYLRECLETYRVFEADVAKALGVRISLTDASGVEARLANLAWRVRTLEGGIGK